MREWGEGEGLGRGEKESGGRSGGGKGRESAQELWCGAHLRQHALVPYRLQHAGTMAVFAVVVARMLLLLALRGAVPAAWGERQDTRHATHRPSLTHPAPARNSDAAAGRPTPAADAESAPDECGPKASEKRAKTELQPMELHL